MITLIGHGYIGTALSKSLNDFEWISHLEKPSKHTTFIINAAGFIGYPNADQCEVEKETCINANVVFPIKLETENKVPIIHISSGCVYQGYPEGGYKEEDEPNLNFNNGSFYGGCKSLLQRMLEPYLSKSYLFRIRLPFDHSRHHRNLLYKYERYEKLVDVENSITSMEDLTKCIDFFLKERPEYGMYNVVNKNTTTTKNITDKMDLVKQWISLEELKDVVKAQRSCCSLSTEKLEKVFNIRTIDEALDKTIYDYRKNNK